MPEGDWLKLTASRLSTAMAQKPLVATELRWPTAAGANLTGATITEVASYGKHLLIRFDNALTLQTHLRMDGFWDIERTGSAAARGLKTYRRRRNDAGAYKRIIEVHALLSNETWTAIGEALGMLNLIPTRDEANLLGHLGPCTLAPDFVEVGVDEALARFESYSALPIAAALLEQRIAAGIGTIWMAESLFSRGIYPWRLVSDIDDDERRSLLLTASRLMNRSVKVGLIRGLGHVPHRVHGQHRKFCSKCGTPIAVGALSGPNSKPDQGAGDRIVFWCRTCQAPN
jgi:endonuclease-8